MSIVRHEYLDRLAHLRQAATRARALFTSHYQDQVESYRGEISRGISEALARMRNEMQQISASNPVCMMLAEQATEYVSWMQWSLWDLPYFAVALRPPFDRFRRAVTACGLAYISIRVFDDVIDRHFSYKGKHTTLLGSSSESATTGRDAQGLTILAGLLLCFEGLNRLIGEEQGELRSVLECVVPSIRDAVIGAIMEYSQSSEWSPAYYDRLVQLKNVHYWKSLYAALDPYQSSSLYPFLERYYDLAQNLNDVQDFDQDQRWDQPNLISLYLPRKQTGSDGCPPLNTSSPRLVPDEVERLLADKFLDLGAQAVLLPEPDCEIAQLKLLEALEEAYRLGLFAPEEPAPGQTTTSRHTFHLDLYADIQTIVQEMGSEALEQVNCPICDSSQRKTMFQKQGFAYHRCANCSHIYISPRIRSTMQAHVIELEDASVENEYLEVQRLYAETICHLLSLRAAGPRLLDVGFGQGYLLKMARLYGFEAYGIDASLARVDRLRPQFGQRIARCILGQEPIPWGLFDIVVMSHILEHLYDPNAALNEIAQHLEPDGLLYIVVPDLDSVAFQIFGKNWDAMNPFVHLQYFTERSLSSLLEKSGFGNVERIHQPQLDAQILPRWMRLMRQLGASDTNELILLAQRSN